MQSKHNSHRHWILFGTALSIIMLSLMGCSDGGNPSALSSNGENTGGMWNPAPGFEIQPGHPIPQLNDNYWEDSEGSHTNPFRRRVPSAVPISDDGGIVTLGLHSYVIPPHAIDSARTFTLAYASFCGVAVDCGPSPYQFRIPVMLSLSYANTNFEEEGIDPSDLRIWFVTPDGAFEPLESIVNPGLQTVSAQVDHFSRYVLG
jgi:hypothetical protein